MKILKTGIVKDPHGREGALERQDKVWVEFDAGRGPQRGLFAWTDGYGFSLQLISDKYAQFVLDELSKVE